MEMMLLHVSYHGIGLDRKWMKRKEIDLINGKVKHPNPLIMLWYIATLE